MAERNPDFILRIQSITHLYPQTHGSSGFFCVANTRPSESPVQVDWKTPSKNRQDGGARMNICMICKNASNNLIIKQGLNYRDQDGNEKRSASLVYHRECQRMQNRGLLNTRGRHG